MKGLAAKVIIVGCAAVSLAAFLWVSLPIDRATAISGCCKQKVGNDWRRIEETFESCRSLNEADGDNVFEPTGTYWWDAGC